MPRVKKSVKTRKRRKRVLEEAKGYRGARGHLYRAATEA
ncbi:MAG: bL20 family ribosomal protein, partial [Deltaproteobacteria bacterium]|nr:bL20 family ribosomal protein [Deltaproteobacteria bacterium]